MLKKLILCVFLNAMAMHVVFADDAQDKRDKCQQYSAFAQQLMALRQQNVPVADVMDRLAKKEQQLKDEGESNKGEYQFYIELTKQAYSTPLYHNDQERQTAVSDFMNKAYLMCMDNLML